MILHIQKSVAKSVADMHLSKEMLDGIVHAITKPDRKAQKLTLCSIGAGAVVTAATYFENDD